MDTLSFHQRTAEELHSLYANQENAPEGWQGALMWHWEQAKMYKEAMNVALGVAQNHISDLAFNEARRWIERSLSLLDRLPDNERLSYGLSYEVRAYALIIAVLEFEGQFREALGYAQLLLRLSEIHGNIEAQGRSYLTIGRVHRELGQLSIAESDLVRALKLAERHQLHDLEWESRFHLAKVHQLQGRHLEAFQQLDLAHQSVTGEGEEVRLARVSTGIGDIYRVLGSGEDALRLYHQALKLELGTNNVLGQAMLYEKLGLSHMELGEMWEALECINEALRLRKQLGDKLGQARSYSILGMVQYRLKEYHQALEHFEQARLLEAGLQNRRGLTIALTNLGDVSRSLEQFAQSRSYYEEALRLARGTGDQLGMARVYERLGDVFIGLNERSVAHEHFSQALQIREEMGHYDEAQVIRDRLMKLDGGSNDAQGEGNDAGEGEHVVGQSGSSGD
jgi:tetratricopeptide (TPR) repeat protein